MFKYNFAISTATIISFLLAVENSKAQTFTNIAFDQNINVVNSFPTLGVAISFYDFDKDGWDDLSFGTKNEALKFYKNNQGDFEQVFFDGIDEVGECKMITWVDYDNDGDADLFVSYSLEPMKLYRNNGDMTFENVAVEAGLEQLETANWGASWADYNRDGLLDFYLCKYYVSGDYLTEYEKLNRLYLNEGDGTFADVTLMAGVSDSIGMSLQSLFWDYDNDKWPDLLVLNDEFFANGSYRNNGDGTFEDSGYSTNLDVVMDAMSASAGDYDNDGDEDMYISNTPNAGGFPGNVLFQNNNGIFSDVTSVAGAEVGNICWGITWFDYDNDGWLDFYVATNQGLQNPPNNKIFRNNSDGTFTDVSGITGMQADVATSYTNCTGDIDNDGYPDLAANNSLPYPSAVFLSSGGNFNYFKFSVEGVVSNKDGIGTKAHCYTDGNLQTRVFYCGESYMAQNSQREIFGLAEYTSIDSLILEWPSGHIDTYFNLAANQTLHFIEGASINPSLNLSGSVGLCEGDSILLFVDGTLDFAWNNNQTSDSIYVTEPGIFFASAVNEFGLQAISNAVEVYFFDNPIPEVASTSTICFDTNDATAGVTNAAGTGINAVYWDGMEGGTETENLNAGTHSVMLVDLNDCVAELEFTVLAPPAINVQIEQINPGCFEGSDGSILLENTGGTGIMEVVWNNELTANPIENLEAGVYQYELTDTNGCVVNGEIEITQPAELLVAIVTTDAIIDVQGGSAEATVSGGTEPYNYAWSNGSEEISIDNLEEGAYALTVTDANQCETEVIFFIDEVVSIFEFQAEELEVYPNPFGNYLLIQKGSPGSEVQIVDSSGKVIFNQCLTGESLHINTENFAPGTYFISLKGRQKASRILIRE